MRLFITTIILMIIGQHAVANSLYDCETTNFVQIVDHDMGFAKTHQFEMVKSGRNVFLRCCPDREFHALKNDYETLADWKGDMFIAHRGGKYTFTSVIFFDEPNFSLVTAGGVTSTITAVCTLK